MAEVLLFHHAQGRTEGVTAFADDLREAGHTVHTPDLLDGKTFGSIPEGMAYVRELGFEEIVIFTNGVKTAREAFVDEVIATGGRFTWRFSVQGATKEAHERTTLKDGSFNRIVQSMRHLAKKGQRITVNMCVVQSNFESVEHFAELVGPVGAVQLHLDMVRPLDAGQRTEEEFAAIQAAEQSLR